ncbi:MAG: hypothetical protein WDZ29_00715 [Balneolaceae bacterium]
MTPTEENILSRLIWIETFDDVLEETGMHRGALKDDLTGLIRKGYIEVYPDQSATAGTPFYDTDHLETYAFKATKTGLSVVQNRPGAGSTRTEESDPEIEKSNHTEKKHSHWTNS